jgi:glucose-6-phosphate isomerase
MITLNLENLFKTGISESDFKSHAEKIPTYLQQIHARKQGFYEIIDDQQLIDSVQEFANQADYSHIVVLGIGGSALGTICLQHALGHLHKQSEPSLHVLDNIDPEFIAEIEDVIDLSETLFIVISKSGGTAETLSQYFYFSQKVEQSDLDHNEHFVFVTDPTEGFLRQIAAQKVTTTFDLPSNVGGRFSVLTAVGLLPAALIGIDIDKLIQGAKDMRDKFLSHDFDANLAFQVATIQFMAEKNINVVMPYVQKLNYFADWYKQLLAESIGKTDTIGITPTKALGVTDQHSQLQLYSEGPNDKLIIFFETQNFHTEMVIPNPYPQDHPYLSGVTFNQLINTEKRGTADALTQNGRPNFTVLLDQLNEYTLGQLFLLFEGATAFLGEYYEIDAFNQPGVELSKKLTKQYLNESA